MGCGASVTKPISNTRKVGPTNEKTKKAQTEDVEVPTLMASLQGYIPTSNTTQNEEETKPIYRVSLTNSQFPQMSNERIECDTIVEFQVDSKNELDIVQVYKDGNDFCPVTNGYELYNIKRNTPENERRIFLSLALQEPTIDLYFCVIPSTERKSALKNGKYPKENCENNCLKLKKCEVKLTLTDERESQKIYLNRGDTLEIIWTGSSRTTYRIEEKKFCPVSGGLYTVEPDDEKSSSRFLAKGKFTRTFDEYGTTFLFRLTDRNEVHDITVCIVNDTYKVKHVKLTDNTIEPNLIWIDQGDSIAFEWNTKRKQTIVQIEPFSIDQQKRQSIELKTPGKNFFWPKQPSCAGFMTHQFDETGIFCYKNATNHIGTIIVQPKRTIKQISILSDQFVYQMNTKDLVQFNWKISESNKTSVFLTIDTLSSVVPEIAGGPAGVFECASHHCIKADALFQDHFNTFETFLLNIPQHGLYNFSATDNPENTLLSVIVENGIDQHRVNYDENNLFKPDTLVIYRNDQVWFDSASNNIPRIYQTDQFGNYSATNDILFEPQMNSVNYFMKEFLQEGIFYFTTDINEDSTKKQRDPVEPLRVVVLPDVRFHYKEIHTNDFSPQPIVTNVGDFVLWQFDYPISRNVIQLHPGSTLKDLVSCHDRAVAGRNRQCLAVECSLPGTFFFANPEFERATGSDQDRLITTILIDPPFGRNTFIITNRQFIPSILYIAQNETVSWTSADHNQIHEISIENERNDTDEKNFNDRNLTGLVSDIHQLHTFSQPGQYIIRSNRFQTEAIVYVDTEQNIRTQKKRSQEPRILENMETTCDFNTQLHFVRSNRYPTTFYSLDGSTPTRYFDNVQQYDPDIGILLVEPGLRVVRAVSIEDGKLPSSIYTSSITFVMESREREILKEQRALWSSCSVTLGVFLQQPNKVFGTIDVQPTNAIELIDHFELLINGVTQRKQISATDTQFSAEGFAGGEQYELSIIAYPKAEIIDAEPIPSNRRAFEIKRDIPGGAPLISLALSNEQSTLYLMWAHIGDHVSEYLVYVDNIEIRSIPEQEFTDMYGIQFHGAQQRRKYLLHVEAKLKNTNEIRKSNVISVISPLESSTKSPVAAQFFPYITINEEPMPTDIPLETVQLDFFANPRPEATRKTETLPIIQGLRNAIPKISYKRNQNGITLFWKTKSSSFDDAVDYYQIVLDNQPYGKTISPHQQTKYQVNLTPGNHECYLEVIPAAENEETFKSNVLHFDYQPPERKYEQKQQKEPSNEPVHNVLEQKDLPIPKLNIQTINSSSIRAIWYLDRGMPSDAYVPMYEVHVRGQDFPSDINSDEYTQQDGYTEHIWHTQTSPLELTGISDRNEYTLFVRALFHVQGLTDIEYVRTQSNEVKTTKVDQLIDLLPRPLLKVTRVGLQLVSLSWTMPDSVDQVLIKGYRIILNSKPTEILPPTQAEYELTGLKPGTENDVQVSVTTHPDFIDEKVSEPIRVVCPQRPLPPKLQAIRSDKPYSIAIEWQTETGNEDEEIQSYKVFLDGKLHGDIKVEGCQTLKYDFTKLQAEKSYRIMVKAVVGEKKLHGYVYRCEVESLASNELTLKCAAPPKGTAPRLERMHPNGVDLVWDEPIASENVKLTGYQILKDGRAVGKTLPTDKRSVTIGDLDIGNRYSFQVVPITDQPGGIHLRDGDEYDPNRHGHYLPGPKLDVQYTDLVKLPADVWLENVTGHSALLCWTPVDQSLPSNIQPDNYKISIWNCKDNDRANAKVTLLPKDKSCARLKDLESNTDYAVQVEASKKRRHQAVNDQYIVTDTSEAVTFRTGSPPDPPTNLELIACTNTAARFRFDSFIEHQVEVKSIRVQCEPKSSENFARECLIYVEPDQTEFEVADLTERTDYIVTVYGLTEEYLNEYHCREYNHLPKKLKPSDWLPAKAVEFQTSGYESVEQLIIQSATTEAMKIEWTLPKVFGSTKLLYQTLQYQLENGPSKQIELSSSATSAVIPGSLPSGLYKLTLDSTFSVQVSLDDVMDDSNRREESSSTSESVTIRFHAPAMSDRPEIYLTGYTMQTLDLKWNKPNLFSEIDHPEKTNEQLKIHRRLVGYRVDIDGKQYNTLDADQSRCTLTECSPGEKYDVQLIAKTVIQKEYFTDFAASEKDRQDEPDETASKKIRFRTLRKQDLLRSFKAEFEFNENNDTNKKQSLGKINIQWTVSDTTNISHFIVEWHSSQDLRPQQKTVPTNETSMLIESCDEKQHYIIDIIVVTNNGTREKYQTLTIPTPGAPDAPRLWLVKTSDTSFIVEWSEPKVYGIPIIGYQLYIEGKKYGDIIDSHLRQAEISSRINRIYQVSVCAVTNNAQRFQSALSSILPVITTPTTNLIPTIYYSNDDGTATSFDRQIARIIPLHIDTVNEEKLYLDWTSFIPPANVKAYYVHYTCLINGDVQAMKISKRTRQTVLKNLRPGFTYGIMIMAVDKNGGVLYTSDKHTIQMNAPPNAPIILITERTNTHVKLEWRPPASYGEVAIAGYKIFVNHRLAAVLRHDQLSYTLTNGIPCDNYTVHVQAATNEKNTTSPLSRGVLFQWPGVRPGAFKRIDDGQTGNIIVAWEHPKIEDEKEKLLGYKLFSENLMTHARREHGEYDPATQQATIHDLNNGKYRLCLQVKCDNHTVYARPIMIVNGRFNSLLSRQSSVDSSRCFVRKPKRLRSPGVGVFPSVLRHTQQT